MTDEPMALAAPGRPLQVLDVVHGEVITIADVTTEEIERLAQLRAEVIAEGIAHLRQLDSDIDRELLARLDRRKRWTLRVGDVADGVQWELTAPSPTAGSVTYDVEQLRTGLRRLLDAGEVDEQAAGEALERTVTIVAQVPLVADLAELQAVLERMNAIGKVPVHNVRVSTAETARAAGVKRLEAGGGAAAELAAAVKRPAPTGRRTVKVKAKRKATS